MNHSLFTCRLTKDPELRRVGSGNTETAVVTLRVAVDDRQRSKERPAVFLDLEAWESSRSAAASTWPRAP